MCLKVRHLNLSYPFWYAFLMPNATLIRAYVGLGSNAGNADEMLARARHHMERLQHVRIGAVSKIYVTQPQDYAEQPWFSNQALELLPRGSWRPLQLLETLLEIETSLGRKRSADLAKRFGPRVIDADLLLYGTECSNDIRCVLPHPRITKRAFVLLPLIDIAPDISIHGIPATYWLSQLDYRTDGNKIFQ